MCMANSVLYTSKSSKPIALFPQSLERQQTWSFLVTRLTIHAYPTTLSQYIYVQETKEDILLLNTLFNHRAVTGAANVKKVEYFFLFDFVLENLRPC